MTAPTRFLVRTTTRPCPRSSVRQSSFIVQGGLMREVIATDDAPKAIGPYSQAIKANGFVFISGQIPIDPATQQLVQGDVAVQTERVLQNLSSILKAAGSSFEQVVKCG